VLQRAEQSRLPLLNRNEALVIAHLLEELGGVYVDKQQGLLARLTANRSTTESSPREHKRVVR